MPFNWDDITVKKYPVLIKHSGKMENTFLHYKLKRSSRGMELEIGADEPLGAIAMRLGPFEQSPDLDKIRVNGQTPRNVRIEHTGDSWWAAFIIGISNR
jgi:hypothetical protein